MPVTQKMLKDLKRLKNTIYTEMREFETKLPPDYNFPGEVALMETRLSIRSGKISALVHGQPFALWQMQEAPDVLWPAFERLRADVERRLRR